ncbi:MAG: uL15 family ribosomal protein [Candidatus Sungbacteria bacterium]|uniref:Large ribosomal subunit protein uL15 n=1 Tax=Candidatus Sungiibacteriota bacterium TaxID=2750080 RepID=A0A933DU31_9BACT|nr:uL15 family ribosomal protein [Candidatus Sungbacteria bacterium]
MQFHTLAPRTKFRKSRRVGRGGKRGTTAGRGTKGQRARAGAKIRPALRDIVKKLPKKRGYRFRSFRPRPAVVNLAILQKHFAGGETIDPEALLKKNLIRRIKGKLPRIKILGGGADTKKFIFREVALSRSARASVEAAGGKVLSAVASQSAKQWEV